MDVGPGDVAFDADNPVVGELIVVADLQAADRTEHPRPVGGGGRGRERDVGAAPGGAEEAAGIEAGPVGGHDHGRRGALTLVGITAARVSGVNW